MTRARLVAFVLETNFDSNLRSDSSKERNKYLIVMVAIKGNDKK